ncbi:hypothetical protein [Actinomadura opuntiae]|uniref:hypothetical protein n=1 Tax=Actinomadura sp. OS1-43 TaxID=604315 RepID=UPI00255B170E|nr:hypothetical protein [Actinomadura sp. OS1-43]MDL4815970.1 hypothetical protein [Actinomadura sp. OS1-43]
MPEVILRRAVRMALKEFAPSFVLGVDEGLLAAILRTSWTPAVSTETRHAALMDATDTELYAVAHEILEEM